MKYTAPSIEVVNFSSSDAPRIGMQWFYWNNQAAYSPAPAGYAPVNITAQAMRDLTQYGINCTEVLRYTCNPETLPADAYFNETTGHSYVADDGASC